MALIQETLVANNVLNVPLDAPTGRVVVTQVAGTAAEVYVTADGTSPVIPVGGGEVPGSEQVLAAVLGQQIALVPPLFGDHMVIPTVRLLSAGTPTVSVQW